MGAVSSISSKGQITLPLEVRKRLGVTSGDKVEFVFDGERTVVKPVREEADPFAAWMGIAKDVPAGFNVDDWISDMRDDEERIADLKEIGLANSR